MVNSKQLLGVVLLIAGIVVVLFGFFSFTNAASGGGGFSSGASAIVSIFIGAIIAIIGGFILFFTSIGKLHKHLASQVAPGLEKTSEAIGKGLSKGLNKKGK